MANLVANTDVLIYVVAHTPKYARDFVKRKGLSNPVKIVERIEDLPRTIGIIALVIGKYHLHPDAELMFGVGGLFYDFKAHILYEREIP